MAARLHGGALQAWLDVELLHLARIGGRCWPTCCRWSSWWPDRQSRCGPRSSGWQVVAVLQVVELVELVALAGTVGRLHQAELLHLARIGGWCWSIYCTWSSRWPVVVPLHAVELVA